MVGLLSQNWPLVGVGVGLFVFGQTAHAFDQRHVDVQLERWATEAVAGIGPIPRARCESSWCESLGKVKASEETFRLVSAWHANCGPRNRSVPRRRDAQHGLRNGGRCLPWRSVKPVSLLTSKC
jgi:hypothetical protein